VHNIILLGNGKVLTPIFTAIQARDRAFADGEDKKGPFVACRLDNRSDARLFGWYILVSPEDRSLMLKYSWHGNINGKKNAEKFVEVRRREVIGGKEITVQLTQEIWNQYKGTATEAVMRTGHLLDFRRCNLQISKRARAQGGHRGVTKTRSNTWQAQITVDGKNTYLGNAASEDDAGRIYNRYLRKLKEERSANNRIQEMPYNDTDPLF